MFFLSEIFTKLFWDKVLKGYWNLEWSVYKTIFRNYFINQTDSSYVKNMYPIISIPQACISIECIIYEQKYYFRYVLEGIPHNLIHWLGLGTFTPWVGSILVGEPNKPHGKVKKKKSLKLDSTFCLKEKSKEEGRKEKKEMEGRGGRGWEGKKGKEIKNHETWNLSGLYFASCVVVCWS